MLDSQADVSDLIIRELHIWNTTLMDEIFWEEVAKLIKSIPLPRVSAKDRWIWHYSNGKLSVKSVNHAIMDSDILDVGQIDLPSSSSGKDNI